MSIEALDKETPSVSPSLSIKEENRRSAAATLLRRRSARESMNNWSVYNYEEGFIPAPPAKHHRFLNDQIDRAIRRDVHYLIILMPPGAAKSTYVSKLAPPYFLSKCVKQSVLACSHSQSLATTFGRACRNLVDDQAKVLQIHPKQDTQAADEWETQEGGRYFCAGVGSKIAGHRFDLGLIDDYLGNQEDADSKVIRDKQWDWFLNDFYPRMKPGGVIMIVANRRNEDDLVGRLLDPSTEGNPIPASHWEVIKLPFFAKDNDVLGRAKGERLWPEWFTEEMAAGIKRLPNRVRAGLYDQEPSPEEGNHFHKDWILNYGYTADNLPKELELFNYCASDHAVSLKQTADSTCLIPCGVDHNGDIWIYRDVWWMQANTDVVVEAFISMGKRRQPLIWWAGADHIKKSIAPFLNMRRIEEGAYFHIEEMTESRDLMARSQPIHGMLSMGKVHFPLDAPWFDKALQEFLMFPAGKHDDFVAALANLGRGLSRMGRGQKRPQLQPSPNTMFRPTIKWVREDVERQQQEEAFRRRGM